MLHQIDLAVCITNNARWCSCVMLALNKMPGNLFQVISQLPLPMVYNFAVFVYCVNVCVSACARVCVFLCLRVQTIKPKKHGHELQHSALCSNFVACAYLCVFWSPPCLCLVFGIAVYLRCKSIKEHFAMLILKTKTSTMFNDKSSVQINYQNTFPICKLLFGFVCIFANPLTTVKYSLHHDGYPTNYDQSQHTRATQLPGST